MNPKNTTSDSDIIARDFIMVDIDPKRVAGTNATNQELERAHLKAVDIYRFLKDNGFNEPIIAMSGNGWHIHIPVALKASQENTDLVKRFLLSLAKIIRKSIILRLILSYFFNFDIFYLLSLFYTKL